jgi:hypothetical protein
MGLWTDYLKNPKNKPIIESYSNKIETLNVAGVWYHRRALVHVGSENAMYSMTRSQLLSIGIIDEKIYEYDFSNLSVVLEPEPTNTHDRNAIKVVVNGRHIGYIPKKETRHVRHIMESDLVGLDIEIYGGPYKRIYQGNDGSYHSTKQADDYVATLHIKRRR